MPSSRLFYAFLPSITFGVMLRYEDSVESFRKPGVANDEGFTFSLKCSSALSPREERKEAVLRLWLLCSEKSESLADDFKWFLNLVSRFICESSNTESSSDSCSFSSSLLIF